MGLKEVGAQNSAPGRRILRPYVLCVSAVNKYLPTTV